MIFRVLFCANLCAIGVGLSWPYTDLQDSFHSLWVGSGVGFLAGIFLGLCIEVARMTRRAVEHRPVPHGIADQGMPGPDDAVKRQRNERLQEALAELDEARSGLHQVSLLLKASTSQRQGGRITPSSES